MNAQNITRDRQESITSLPSQYNGMPINRQIQEKCQWMTKSKSLGLHDEFQRSPSLHDGVQDFKRVQSFIICFLKKQKQGFFL